MQRQLAFLFTFLYITAMVKPALPIVEFYLNQDFIIAFLCINKEKPKLQCNGKCHLKKMIAKDKEEDPLQPNVNLREYPLALLQNYQLEKTQVLITIKPKITFYHTKYSFLFDSSLWRPPIV